MLLLVLRSHPFSHTICICNLHSVKIVTWLYQNPTWWRIYMIIFLELSLQFDLFQTYPAGLTNPKTWDYFFCLPINSSITESYLYSASPGNTRPTVRSRPTTATSQKCEYRERCERFIKSLNIAGLWVLNRKIKILFHSPLDFFTYETKHWRILWIYIH